MPSKNRGKSYQIVAIKYLKNKVRLVFTDNKIEISNDTFVDFHLYPNKTIEQKELDNIIKREIRQKYINYCIRIISKNSYSEQEISSKLLKRNIDHNDLSYVILYLKNLQLINDEQFIFDYLDYANYMHYGKMRIIDGLLKKGASHHQVEKLNFLPEDELQKALYHLPNLENKYSKYSYKNKKLHIHQSLLRLGFESSIIDIALSNVKSLDNDKEFENAKADYIIISNRLKERYDVSTTKRKIISYLLNKGYNYNIINKVLRG